GSLLRVQCKTAVMRGDVLAVPWYSNRRGPNGFVKRPYTADEIDAVAAFSPELRRSFWLPIAHFPNRAYVQLRLAPTRNNQRSKINWADDFALDARLGALLGP